MSIIEKQKTESFKEWKEKEKEYLRQEYPILENKNSLFIDLGVFNGNWSKQILDKYPLTSGIGFEPILKNFEKSKSKLNSETYTLYNVAAGAEDGTIEISKNGPSSSSFSKKNLEICKKIDFSSFVFDLQRPIDLLKLNIEGDEYEVLEKLASENLLKNIVNIQVQFHTFIPDAESKYESIKSKLLETHYLTFDYPFIWQNFRVK